MKTVMFVSLILVALFLVIWFIRVQLNSESEQRSIRRRELKQLIELRRVHRAEKKRKAIDYSSMR